MMQARTLCRTPPALAAALLWSALLPGPAAAQAQEPADRHAPPPPAAAAIDPATSTAPEAAGAAAVAAPVAADAAAPSALPPPVPMAAGTLAPPAVDNLNGAHVLKEKRVRLDRGDDNVVRSGPGNTFAIVGVYPKGAEFTVIAKKADWYNVRLSDVQTGWVHASLCHEFDDMSDLEFRPNPRLFSRIGSFALTGYAGGYAFDRKSNSLALGGRLGYYVLEFLEVEGGISWTHIHRPAEIVETLFGLTLEAEEFHMLYYELNGNLHLLPGRQMVPFLTGGVGSTIAQGKSEASANYGAGVSMYVSKTVAVRWEVRNYRFSMGSESSRRTDNNIEFSIGTTLLF
jgi:outer membrane beta-barrel protein